MMQGRVFFTDAYDENRTRTEILSPLGKLEIQAS